MVALDTGGTFFRYLLSNPNHSFINVHFLYFVKTSLRFTDNIFSLHSSVLSKGGLIPECVMSSLLWSTPRGIGRLASCHVKDSSLP